MKLSLCMIVKDAEDTLERALESVKDLVDEMVIVDTGSTDGTPGIIAKYADIQDTIEWEGFAHARNHSMDLATGNVLLILDSDEYISKGHEFIREAADVPDLICGKVPVLNKVKKGPVLGEHVNQLRLFRNVPEIRYVHAIHNQIEDQVHAYAKKWMRLNGQAGTLAAISAEIVHTGYDLSDESVVEKYGPRLALLREEIKKARADGHDANVAYFQFQYALMLHMLFSTEEALDLWKEIDLSKLNASNRWYANYTAARANLHAGNLDEALVHCGGMYGSQRVPGQPLAPEAASHMISGIVLIEKGRRDDGLLLLIQAFLDNINPMFGTRCILNGRMLLKDIAHFFDDPDVTTVLLGASAPADVIEYVRGLQKQLEPLPDEVLELI